MDRTAYNPETGIVYVPNKEGTAWEELGPLDSISPEIKYVPNKVAKDSNGNSFMFNKFLKTWEEVPTGKDLVDYIPPLPNSIKRGIRTSSLVDDYIGMTTGFTSKEDYAKAVKDAELRNKQIPIDPKIRKGYDEIVNSKTYTELAENVIKNPYATAEMLGESIGSMAGPGGVALGLTGVGRLYKLAPWALTAISAGSFGTGSGLVESTTSLLEGLKEEGVNTLDEKAVKEALDNPQTYEKLQTKAQLRGIAIGAFDAFSGGVAGNLGKNVLEKGITKTGLLKAGIAETVVQGGLGASGEATAQLVTEGEIKDKAAVGLEAILEGVMGVPQAVTQSIITSPTSPSHYPVMKGMLDKAGNYKLEEEIVGTVQKKKGEKKKVREEAGKVLQSVIDPQEAQGLTAFQSLIETIQPEDLKTDNLPKTFTGLAEQIQPKRLKNKTKVKEDLNKPKLQANSKSKDNKIIGTDYWSLSHDIGFEVSARRLKNIIPDYFYSLTEKEKRKWIAEYDIKRESELNPKPKSFSQMQEDMAAWESKDELDDIQYAIKNNNKPNVKSQVISNPNFKSWLKDSVADIPTKFYHGTDVLFDKFKEGETHWFTSDKNAASTYTEGTKRGGGNPRIIEVAIKPNNPKIIDAKGKKYNDLPNGMDSNQAAALAKIEGYDSLVIFNVVDNLIVQDTKPTTIIAVFDDALIFDSNVDNIYLQATRELVANNPALSDSYEPIVAHLKGIRYNPNLESNKNYIKEIEKAIRKIVGENAPLDISFYEDIQSTDAKDADVNYRGFQALNMIGISMNVANGVQTDPFETGVHEAYHALKTYGAITQQDQKILDAQRNRIHAYVREQTGILPEDILSIYESNEGSEELEAIAFGLWAANKAANEKYKASKFTPILNAIFDKIYKILNAIGSVFKDKSFEDVFTDIYEGRRTVDALQDARDTSANIRWQKIAQKIQAQEQSEKTKYAYKAPNEIELALKRDNKELGPLGVYGRFISSMQHLASKSKLMASILDTYRTKELIANFVMDQSDSILNSTNFFGLSRPQIEAIHNLMDYNRKSKQKATLDSDGLLTFKRGNKIVRLKDPVISQQYMTLQKSYEFIKEQVIENAKHKIARNLGLPLNFTKEQVIEQLNKTNDNNKQRIYTNILDTLNTFEEMASSDYTPHQRFGDFGISVKNKKTGKLKAFYTVERGEFLNKHKKYYNKSQLEDILKNLKEKYSDSKKYEIIGASGPIKSLTSIDDLNPFILTHNNITANVGNAMVSFDLLFSLLQSKNLDPDVLEDIQTNFYEQIINKGFAKHMLQSDNIDGYSKDWMRVQHSYRSGAANYIGNLAVSDKLNAIQKVIKEGAFKDKGLRDAATGYVNYMNSSQQDFMRMRAFNFTWTMGFNFSTAALQVMTLPTMTVSNISKFNANPISNMAAVNKWFWIASSFFKEFSFREGNIIVDFDKESRIQELKDRGLLDQGAEQLLRFMTDNGLTTAVQMEEYAGRKAYDTKSLVGKSREGLSMMANAAGAPISLMEQMTRFATVMAAYEQLKKTRNVEQKIMKVFGNNQLFMTMLENNKGKLDPIQVASWHILDEAHAIFSKLGRAPWERGIGGALFFPFMRYPHNALESMVRMWGQGTNGKVALVTTLGTMFVIAGLLGLPGAELLKELYEEAYKRFDGREIDLDYEVRKAIYNATGDSTLATFVTKGGIRAYGGIDLTSRLAMTVPGQEMLFGLTGIKGDASEVLGVQGGILSQIGEAYNKYNTDASLNSTMSSLTPTALSNMFKAWEYTGEGVYTSRNQKLIDNEDLGMTSIILRGMGFTSNEVATYRERNFYSKTVGKQLTPFLEKQRERAKKALNRYYDFMDKGDRDRALEYQQQYAIILQEVLEKSRDTGIPVDIGAFGRSVIKGVIQRQYPEETFTKNLPKAARSEKEIMDDVLGIE